MPVAVDQHIHRHKKDAEGELFAKVLKQANRGLDGYSQGVYLFTPDGKLLAFANTADAAGVRRLTQIALKKFEPNAAPIKLDDAKVAPVLPPPPEGGLVLDVTSKVLGGYDKTDKRIAHHINSLGRDHLWLRKDEADALAQGMLLDTVKQRLVRYHLIDNTRGEPPMWRVDEIKKLDLMLKAGKLAGSVHLETKTGERGYQAELLGTVETKDGKVTRLDLVAKGDYWGEGTFSRGAPKGRFPFAVAFSLADGDCATSKVPPQGARGNLKAYLK
ncbi:MAG: hypothetical protein FJ303_23880 [Planctomycetes bacterium]|nr:hypothetical protein [Planctomycetota bacterium]